MPDSSHGEFGKRRPVVVTAAAQKRSGHVALLLAGTVAIGGGAYALMPGQTCDPNVSSLATDGSPTGCSARQSSSSSNGGHGYAGGSSSRTGIYSDASSSDSRSSGAGTSSVTRGGFGAIAHAFTSHFSGGG